MPPTQPTGTDELGASKKRYLRTIFLPNSSPIPNWWFVDILSEPEVPHAARSVCLFLFRKTIGWDRRVEELSLRDIQFGASVSRPVAIHCVRIICDCWGLFHKSRGYKGQHASRFTVGKLGAEEFLDRRILIEGIYGTIFPSPKQLRERPCTVDVLRAEKTKLDLEDAA